MQERQRRTCARKAAQEVCKKGSTGSIKEKEHRKCAKKAAQGLCKKGSAGNEQKRCTESIEGQHKDYTRQGAQELYKKKQDKKYTRKAAQ
jgi:hypothetical protein